MTNDVDPSWDKSVDEAAHKLLADNIMAKGTFTSLDFKMKLREVVGKEKKVLQHDVSRFLRAWFTKFGKKEGYTYVERKVPAIHFEYMPTEKPSVKDEAWRLLDRPVDEVTPKEYREMLMRVLDDRS